MLKVADINKEHGVRINYRHQLFVASSSVSFGQ